MPSNREVASQWHLHHPPPRSVRRWPNSRTRSPTPSCQAKLPASRGSICLIHSAAVLPPRSGYQSAAPNQSARGRRGRAGDGDRHPPAPSCSAGRVHQRLLARTHEFDDRAMPDLHPSSVAVPAALAVVPERTCLPASPSVWSCACGSAGRDMIVWQEPRGFFSVARTPVRSAARLRGRPWRRSRWARCHAHCRRNRHRGELRRRVAGSQPSGRNDQAVPVGLGGEVRHSGCHAGWLRRRWSHAGLRRTLPLLLMLHRRRFRHGGANAPIGHGMADDEPAVRAVSIELLHTSGYRCGARAAAQRTAGRGRSVRASCCRHTDAAHGLELGIDDFADELVADPVRRALMSRIGVAGDPKYAMPSFRIRRPRSSPLSRPTASTWSWCR
jgi:hypothetical protein